MAIRARDLRRNITELGFEKGVVHTLELALEVQVEQQQTLRTITELLDQCIDEVTKLSLIGDQVRTVVNQLRRDITKEHEDGEHS